MKKILLSILILLVSCESHTRLVETYFDNNNLKSYGRVLADNSSGISLRDGIWTEYYVNGQVKSVGVYKRDYYMAICPPDARIYYNYKFGFWKYYYQNGQVKAQGQYKIVCADKLKNKECFGIVDENWAFYDSLGNNIPPTKKIILEIELVPFDEELEKPQLFKFFNHEKQSIELTFRPNF